MDQLLMHSGVAHDHNPPGRGSGRYGWGTGENPHQHEFNFISEYQRFKKDGMTDAEVAKLMLGINPRTGEYYTSTDLRAEYSIARATVRQFKRSEVLKIVNEAGGNKSKAARILSERTGEKYTEGNIRSFLNEQISERTDRYQNTADQLMKRVDEVKILDISKGVEDQIGVSDYTKKVAIAIAERKGYIKTFVNQATMDPNKKISVTVLASPNFWIDKENNKFDFAEIQRLATKTTDGLGTIRDFTPDQGKTWWVPEFPEMLDSKRVYVRYKEDGGADKEGVIELKRGVEDISLGDTQYAQVRIGVDGTHYMKGMAMYADDKDFPPGCDVIYNTKKKKSTPFLGPDENTIAKPLKRNKETGEVDRENPFGALIKLEKEDDDGRIHAGGQRKYIGEDGKEHLSPVNKLREEGDWDSWSRSVASQFLSKQPLKLIKNQLNLTVSERQAELESIQRLENPILKQKLLTEFSDKCDHDAARLAATGFKNQAFQVLLPINSMKPNEVYAPQYKNGDTVALIRYPHGGIFEIPILTVNNNNKEAAKVMFDAKDAIGIHKDVADQLSGADFDGDTALVIPLRSNGINVSHTVYPKTLREFDVDIYKMPDYEGTKDKTPKSDKEYFTKNENGEYIPCKSSLKSFKSSETYYEKVPGIKSQTKQNEMGRVTNLINDMTVQGADLNDIYKATKHSMVVIDAEKHHLDYKLSERENDIIALKKKYQGVNSRGQAKGASTILSRAGSEVDVVLRKEVNDINKMTPEERKRYAEGKKVYHEDLKIKKKPITDPKKMTPEELKLYEAGKKVYRESNEYKKQKVEQMYLTDDAMTLVRDPGNQKEVAYANFANSLKGLANEARKEARSIRTIPVDPQAAKIYAPEVQHLKEQVKAAKANQPRERKARAIANAEVSIKKKSNPDMTFEQEKRERAMAMNRARAAVGAKREPIVISDREWEAIQANAISSTTLRDILANTDSDKLKKRATPKGVTQTITPAIASWINSLKASGNYTQREIAERVGVSPSAVSKYLSEAKATS